ncbi:acyl-ACP thioesterase [Paludibacter propionicigenes WB4]|uniref:Acyl-ACP thioesterase n=1 Tax=Paludibacter propionicigenes (strain DSM 17365 / JCM 13257 / WB4) TaxID=694427 RepID=E4T0E2_PALPW|nr:acyl-ACP thioesterase domain-containing protein [Paludibacter propionicigenes]ADQ78301.1 acyl-ACP thioesterase [Paludibacter propionicigenes WB4]
MSLKKTYSFQIQPQFVDFQFRATMSSLGDILLTTAQFNADDNGFGLRRLNEMDCSWVLTRMAIEMNRFPEQYENIEVETWVEEVGRANTTRNFCIRDAKGEIIGNACSVWVFFDMKTRRAKDLQTLEGIHDFANGEEGLIDKPIKLGAVDGDEYDGFKVKYSDIDINGHVNSIRYIQWISDCFSLSCYRKYQVKRFEINYVHEMLYGDFVEIVGMKVEDNDFRFEIKKDDKIACRARVVLIPNTSTDL